MFPSYSYMDAFRGKLISWGKLAFEQTAKSGGPVAAGWLGDFRTLALFFQDRIRAPRGDRRMSQYNHRSEYGVGTHLILEAIEARPDDAHSLANYRHAISEINYQIRQAAEPESLLARRDKLRERYKAALDARCALNAIPGRHDT